MGGGPVDGGAGGEDRDRVGPIGDACRESHRRLAAGECECFAVHRQAVEGGAVKGCKAFERLKCACVLECLGKAGERNGRCEAAR